jgi:hypothetical protein
VKVTCVTFPFRHSARMPMRPGRGLELELGDRFLHRDHAGLQEDRGHGDGVPAAHDGVLHLLHDDVAGGCVGVLRRHDEVAARGRISAGFTKHQQAQLVVVLLQPPHLLVDGLARDGGYAAGDDPHRDSGVGLDHVEHPCELH